MSKQFKVDERTFVTSTYTQQKETDWCVGVGSTCDCHVGIADSKTREIFLDFPNGEFTAFTKLFK